MPAVLVMDEVAQSKLDAIRRHAEHNPITSEVVQEIMDGRRCPVGDDPDFKTTLDFGYTVVYSVEKQPFGWCRHISISLATDRPDELMPHPEAIREIMKMCGFDRPLEQCLVYLEEDISPKAVNILCPVEPKK